ncbi:MAG: bifunctional 4-hydroxy-2-oxoglutarate aldolase/2-dehydro-3-deoxy-phosphogluconate aldolase [Gammaproteobacteria bacterium]|nr:bifunctional 4-hydroxy-2-oxoglutarate aldolase/2-dehydro-3-deoxy-phosphogluconate aldolase [Gammaproteobacteria bacterium]
MDATSLLAGARVIPVVVIDDAEQAVPLAKSLADAGLESIEVTLRTAAALEAITRIAAEVPHMVVGAGSLRKAEHVVEVQKAGAQFAVAPGATDQLLDAADAAGMPMVPGAATASEMMRLFERGYVLQKFFPAELAGGIPYLEAVGAPLPELRFVPTGGISAELAKDYLALANVAAVGGSWITPVRLLETGDFDGIARIAAAAARLGM